MSVTDISFGNDRSVSIDIEDVTGVTRSGVMELQGNTWFTEIAVRTVDGTVTIQLVSRVKDGLASLT